MTLNAYNQISGEDKRMSYMSNLRNQKKNNRIDMRKVAGRK